MTRFLTDLTKELAAITKIGTDITIMLWGMKSGAIPDRDSRRWIIMTLEDHLTLVDTLHHALQSSDECYQRVAAKRIYDVIKNIQDLRNKRVHSDGQMMAIDKDLLFTSPLEQAEKPVIDVLTKLSTRKRADP